MNYDKYKEGDSDGRDPRRAGEAKRREENNITIYEEDLENGGKHLSREHNFTQCVAPKQVKLLPKRQPTAPCARKTKVVCMNACVLSSRMYIRCLPVG